MLSNSPPLHLRDWPSYSTVWLRFSVELKENGIVCQTVSDNNVSWSEKGYFYYLLWIMNIKRRQWGIVWWATRRMSPGGKSAKNRMTWLCLGVPRLSSLGMCEKAQILFFFLSLYFGWSCQNGKNKSVKMAVLRFSISWCKSDITVFFPYKQITNLKI